MNETLQHVFEQIHDLEQRAVQELKRKEGEYRYRITGRKVTFPRDVIVRHKRKAKKILQFLYEAGVGGIVIAAVMYSLIVRLAFLDAEISFFQLVVFSRYRIPKVRRGDYIALDRHRLSYLNAFEKLNCAYCGYANGLLGYAREIASRTERHWCPIRHALRTRTAHSQYPAFFDYGDADGYRARLEIVRNDYDV